MDKNKNFFARFIAIKDRLCSCRTVCFILLAFMGGCLAGNVITVFGSGKSDPSQVRQGGYHFINPLIECEVGNKPKYRPFEEAAKKSIREITDKNPDIVVAVYFRNLNNGPWFGINEQEGFIPASLLKVPLMIAYLKVAEKEPELLQKKYRIVPGNDVFKKQAIEPAVKLEYGKEYTVDELIYHMIVFSDNRAAETLIDNISEAELARVYNELGVKELDGEPEVLMSVKEYASFFRILYNASYLNHEMSEKALSILARSDFHDALEAGVVSDLEVAHKFGEQGIGEGKERIVQFHDCGIVYYPGYPYLLCIMTRGNDVDKNIDIISDISASVYDQIAGTY